MESETIAFPTHFPVAEIRGVEESDVMVGEFGGKRRVGTRQIENASDVGDLQASADAWLPGALSTTLHSVILTNLERFLIFFSASELR